MTRPGFVLQVDDRTPDLLTLAGSNVRLRSFPEGTKVVYAPEPQPSTDPVPLIDGALAAPVDSDSFASRLRPGMRLTLVVGSVHQVQPRMRFDVRRSIVERLLERAAHAGVDDVQIVVASGLSPRWSTADVVAALGDRVAASFLPDGAITSHDVASPDLVKVASVDGEAIRMNPRIAESDLVVVVDVYDGRHTGCLLVTGATDAETINRIGGFDGSSEAVERVTAAVHDQLNVFGVIGVLGQPWLGPTLSFLNAREWEWRLPEQLAYAGARQLVGLMPAHGAQKLYGSPRADYALLDVIAGDVGAVQTQVAEVWRAANLVAVPPADTLITSVWGSSFDQGDPVGSPISAARHALVERASAGLVKDGGVLIAFHPLTRRFSNRLQSPTADFFAKVLPQTRDPERIRSEFEAKAAADDWYLKLYREHNAYHPLAVFHSWYAISRAAKRLSEVIWVGASRESAARLGHRAATTLADALELTGGGGDITYLRGPGTTGS